MGAEPPLEAAARSGLVVRGAPLLVLASGGADSTCLLDVAVRVGARVSALHVNHGLRAEAAADEAHVHELCERLGVELRVEAAPLDPDAGNLQAAARELRYAHAERLAEGDYATAHTLSDQAETVVYRLAVSPGRRALLGMAPRRGRLVRPLLEAMREDTRAYCEARGLAWREDASNLDPRFARARVREEVLSVLRELNPAAERNIAETSRLLRDEAEVLDAAVEQALSELGAPAVPLADLRARPPALARLVLRRLAESGAGRDLALSRGDVDALLRLGETGGSATLDLGGGLRAVAEYGVLRFTTATDAEPPEPVDLPIPGGARFGSWEVTARLGDIGDAVLAAGPLGTAATIRAWREGDRMRPAGLGGTKSLQDLFTDNKVPRALRRTLPVVEASGEIAWVAGLATGEAFLPEPGSPTIALSAKRTGA